MTKWALQSRPSRDNARIALRPLRRSELWLIYDALEWNAERLEGATWDDHAEQRDRLLRELRGILFPPKTVLL